MKDNIFILLFSLIFLSPAKAVAQPGAYGGFLKFKVYKDGKLVDLSDKNWKIVPNHGSFKEPAKPYEYPNHFDIIPIPTPMGGTVGRDFYLDIVFKKDTMRVFTPNFSSDIVTLDSIPFKKGNYKIPDHIYHLKPMINKNKAFTYTPTLENNWEIFSIDGIETYKCFIEKKEDIDHLGRRSPYKTAQEWDRMRTEGNKMFSYRNNIMITTEDEKSFVIFEVKNISDTTFWGENILGNIQINAVFQKGDDVYALIEKFYGGTHPSGTTYGIYKLHFVEKSVSNKLVNYLKKKQTDEDHEAVTKFINNYPDPNVFKNRLEEIQAEYDEAIRRFKEQDL